MFFLKNLEQDIEIRSSLLKVGSVICTDAEAG